MRVTEMSKLAIMIAAFVAYPDNSAQAAKLAINSSNDDGSDVFHGQPLDAEQS